MTCHLPIFGLTTWFLGSGAGVHHTPLNPSPRPQDIRCTARVTEVAQQVPQRSCKAQGRRPLHRNEHELARATQAAEFLAAVCNVLRR